MKVSVTLITLNEGNNITKCLDSVKEIADEIILVDSGSVDDTVVKAKEYTDKIYTRKFDNFASQKNFALENASCDWILSIDADEILSDELINEICAIKKKGTSLSGYSIPRKNIILGREIKHSRWSPDRHIWFWKKDRGRWFGEIHEEVVVNGRVAKLKGAKIHNQYETVSDFFVMVNSYSSFEANMFSKSHNLSYLSLLINPLKTFFGRFFLKSGYLDGWRGFVLCYMLSIYRISSWVKSWEKQKSN